jgi:hypothetical protein
MMSGRPKKGDSTTSGPFEQRATERDGSARGEPCCLLGGRAEVRIGIDVSPSRAQNALQRAEILGRVDAARFVFADDAGRNGHSLGTTQHALQARSGRDQPFGPLWMQLRRAVLVEPRVVHDGDGQCAHGSVTIDQP